MLTILKMIMNLNQECYNHFTNIAAIIAEVEICSKDIVKNVGKVNSCSKSIDRQ
jgi:hypothetical protein